MFSFRFRWTGWLMGCSSLLLVNAVVAQTSVEKTVSVGKAQQLILDFDYPELKVQTWTQPDVLIKGTVSINQGENDKSFEIRVEPDGANLRISSVLAGKDSIPRRVTIKMDDQSYYFKAGDVNDPVVQEFLKEKGRDYTYLSIGILKDIHLQIFIPENLNTQVISKYGLVEVPVFKGPLSIDSKYGKVDVTLLPAAVGEIVARSRYGEILTNLDVTFDQEPYDRHDHWTEITARPGKGPAYHIESKYGNVYLRK